MCADNREGRVIVIRSPGLHFSTSNPNRDPTKILKPQLETQPLPKAPKPFSTSNPTRYPTKILKTPTFWKNFERGKPESNPFPRKILKTPSRNSTRLFSQPVPSLVDRYCTTTFCGPSEFEFCFKFKKPPNLIQSSNNYLIKTLFWPSSNFKN